MNTNMNMNSNESSQLKELREQVEQLRRMLGKEEIVNQKMMRRVMRSKADVLRRRSVVLIVVAILLIPYSLWALSFLGLPPVMGYVTAAFALVAAIYDALLLSQLPASLFTRGTLLEISAAAVRYKKMHIYWLFVAIPFLLFFVWMFFRFAEGNAPMRIGMYVGLGVGAIVGCRTLANTLRTTQEIIDQIDDLRGSAGE
ncbi:MAG: hypothetical protein II323_06140 [Tidjanibacter sp.]|nr:hypothetical protein [Tidjanibacter sp.]